MCSVLTGLPSPSSYSHFYVGSMYDDIHLHVARSYTSSADSPFSLLSSFTLSNHLLLGLPLFLLPCTFMHMSLQLQLLKCEVFFQATTTYWSRMAWGLSTSQKKTMGFTSVGLRCPKMPDSTSGMLRSSFTVGSQLYDCIALPRIKNDSRLSYLGAEFETECATFRPVEAGRNIAHSVSNSAPK